jgi:hypothetical protein
MREKKTSLDLARVDSVRPRALRAPPLPPAASPTRRAPRHGLRRRRLERAWPLVGARDWHGAGMRIKR